MDRGTVDSWVYPFTDSLSMKTLVIRIYILAIRKPYIFIYCTVINDPFIESENDMDTRLIVLFNTKLRLMRNKMSLIYTRTE